MTGRRVTPDIVEKKAVETPPKEIKREGTVGGQGNGTPTRLLEGEGGNVRRYVCGRRTAGDASAPE